MSYESEKQRRQLQTNLSRAEAFVTKYVMILSKLSGTLNSLALISCSVFKLILLV